MMRAWWCVLALACGGGTTQQSSSSTPLGEQRVPNPAAMAIHAEIPLEAGVLKLGASNASSDEVVFVIEAPKGQLTLFACDHVEAETAENGFDLADVGYEDAGESERIGGTTTRRNFQRLANEAAPRIQTCEEELELDDEMVRLLRAFLAGRAPRDREHFDTRAIALEGLELAMTIGDHTPDTVRLEMMVENPQIPIEECELHAMTGDRMLELDVDWDESERQRGDADLTVNVPRADLAVLAASTDVKLIVCGFTWPLDEMSLQTISSLVSPH